MGRRVARPLPCGFLRLAYGPLRRRQFVLRRADRVVELPRRAGRVRHPPGLVLEVPGQLRDTGAPFLVGALGDRDGPLGGGEFDGRGVRGGAGVVPVPLRLVTGGSVSSSTRWASGTRSWSWISRVRATSSACPASSSVRI